MRPVQYFSKEYLKQCEEMSPEEIVEFLESFRELHAGGTQLRDKSRLIRMKVPESLLNAFKTQARLHGVPYQTQIKRLMLKWLDSE